MACYSLSDSNRERIHVKRLLATFFLFQSLAAGTILFDITPNSKNTPPGGISNSSCMNGSLMCLLFSGTITPDPFADTYINDIQISFLPTSVGLTHNSNLFFSAVPGLLFSTDPAYTGFIFEIDVSPAIFPGLYLGTAVLVGGTGGPGDTNPLATANFSILVTAPEPASASMIVLGWAVLAGIRKFRIQDSVHRD